jgi:7-carboxy-7-deazaguanine synthase
MNVPQIQISEIFRSIQGEGILSGYDTLFLRFQGCKIGCKWCDTKYSWKTGNKYKWKVSELCNHISTNLKYPRESWICITGGEPLEQSESLLWLVEKLHDSDYKKISIETSGIISCDAKGKVILPDAKEIVDLHLYDVFFSVSPKLPSALGKRFDEDEFHKIYHFWTKSTSVPYKLQLKYVVSSVEDLEIIDRLFRVVGIKNNPSHISLQLEESTIGKSVFIAKVMNLTQKYPNVKISVQQHKVLKLK